MTTSRSPGPLPRLGVMELDPEGGQNTRTDPSDSGTNVEQNGRTSVAYLVLDGELSLDVD